MGDRGNIAIIQHSNEQVWLYSHWGGTELPERLKDGLTIGKGRWNDESYLAKIIIGAAVPAKNWSEETGYGISTTMQDNEHDILAVSIPSQKVFLVPESDLDGCKVPANYKAAQSWTFSEYVALGKLPEI